MELKYTDLELFQPDFFIVIADVRSRALYETIWNYLIKLMRESC